MLLQPTFSYKINILVVLTTGVSLQNKQIASSFMLLQLTIFLGLYLVRILVTSTKI